ncbi:MAG: hypothetical protein JO006_09535 [Paucibacter sp.]|nr:hypothetical protein [Roseateles sp.]
MARIRSIKPEYWVSEQVAECSTNARLTFVGLWNFCDDNGVHPAKPKTLKAELYPMDDFSSSDVSNWIAELIAARLIVEFESSGERYWHVTGWAKHQKIDRPSCKYPAPPDDSNSESVRSILADSSSNDRRAPPPGVDRKGEDRKGIESCSPNARTSPSRKVKRSMPSAFCISTRVQAWAEQQGFKDLGQHLEAFKAKCAAKDYRYVDWDSAFMEAIREDWARLRSPSHSRPNGHHSADIFGDGQ